MRKRGEGHDRPPQKGDGLTSQFNFTMLPDALQDDESMGRRELAGYWAIARHAGKLILASWIDKERRSKADGARTGNLYTVRRERPPKMVWPAATGAGGGPVKPVDGGSQVAGPPPSNGLTLTIPNELDPSKEELPPPGDKAKKKKIPGFRECTDHFFKLFKDHYKNTKSPSWGGKETNLLKLDLKRGEGDHGYLQVAREVFFDGDHRKTKDFAAEAGYEYGVFHGCLGGLLEHMRRETEAKNRFAEFHYFEPATRIRRYPVQSPYKSKNRLVSLPP